MPLSFRPRRHRWPRRVLLSLAAVTIVTNVAVLSLTPERLVGWLAARAGRTPRSAPVVLVPLVPDGMGDVEDLPPSARNLPAASIAQPGCCRWQGVAVERAADGCDWAVVEWAGAGPTRVPVACPEGVGPRRDLAEHDGGDNGTIAFVRAWPERGPEGCRWLAALWADDVVTRAPVACPGDRPVTMPRRWIPELSCLVPPAPTPGPGVRGPRAGSLLNGCRVVAYYGHPAGAALGVLGDGPPEMVVPRLVAQAGAYTAADPARPALPAAHVVEAVAQPDLQPDGSSLLRLSPEATQRWLDDAERHDLLLFLDLQIGHSRAVSEVERLAPLLVHPRVHLALDPEFAMPAGVRPGADIGSLSAATINEVQAALERLAEAEGLPNKILVVHQFTPDMLADKADLGVYPRVDLVIDMDGYGDPASKRAHYAQFVRDDGAPFGGIKLFFGRDVPLLTPVEVIELWPHPAVVIYQ